MSCKLARPAILTVLQSRGCSIVDAGQEKYPKLCHGTLQQACRHVSMYPCLVRCRRREAGERWREISMEIAQSTAGTAESGGVLSRLCGRFGRFYTGVSASGIELGQDWEERHRRPTKSFKFSRYCNSVHHRTGPGIISAALLAPQQNASVHPLHSVFPAPKTTPSVLVWGSLTHYARPLSRNRSKARQKLREAS
jgi:hypothetical protein